MTAAPRPVGAYTPIVRAGDWLVVSGQVGMGSAGRMVSGGTASELRQAIANLEAHLATEGARLDQVVKTTVFLRHMSDYQVMNDTYIECFGDHRPARSAVGVAELPIGALIEVEAWAWVGDRSAG
jgi:2-iminobutanoate/2-iminopropanoate deaminase